VAQRWMSGTAGRLVRGALAAGLVVTWAIALVGAGPAQAVACQTGIVEFSSTAAEQCYTVPTGASVLAVTLVGAKGGDQSPTSEGAGGLGATVTAWIPVTAGSTLYVEVGQNGVEAHNTGGGATFGGGGAAGSDGSSGGGASDIRSCSMTAGSCPGGGSSLDSRLVVAGGGGGAGDIGISSADPFILPGGNGGAAGGPGIAGAADADGDGGGAGGGAGTASCCAGGGKGGSGASWPGADGGAGALGQGGAAPGPVATNTPPWSGGGGGRGRLLQRRGRGSRRLQPKRRLLGCVGRRGRRIELGGAECEQRARR